MFHRIDNIYDMPSVKFIKMALRIACYPGVLYRRVLAEIAEEEEGGETKRVDSSTGTSIRADPTLSGVIEVGKA